MDTMHFMYFIADKTECSVEGIVIATEKRFLKKETELALRLAWLAVHSVPAPFTAGSEDSVHFL